MRKAVVVAADRAGLAAASEALRKGGNVAFPTETVYGLGANALDEAAVLRVFEAKGRPLTDPLIVHVLDAAGALSYVKCAGETKRIFSLLAERFWPGPLTMVLSAADNVPKMVGANTGFIGVRAPAHPTARALLEGSGLPVAAPSANRFGHVSPTSSQHVLDDLGDKDIMVVDGGDLASSGVCAVGIESTVLKVEDSSISCDDKEMERKLVLFRRGGVPETAMRAALDQAGMFNVKIVSPKPKEPTQEDNDVVADTKKASIVTEDDLKIANEAPGQLITHYAPDVETWLLRRQPEQPVLPTAVDANSVIALNYSPSGNSTRRLVLGECAVLDFGGTLYFLRPHVLAYRDLSADGSVTGAAQSLFNLLRWAENTGAKHVLIQDLSFVIDDLAPSVADRQFRAASGKVAEHFSL